MQTKHAVTTVFLLAAGAALWLAATTPNCAGCGNGGLHLGTNTSTLAGIAACIVPYAAVSQPGTTAVKADIASDNHRHGISAGVAATNIAIGGDGGRSQSKKAAATFLIDWQSSSQE